MPSPTYSKIQVEHVFQELADEARQSGAWFSAVKGVADTCQALSISKIEALGYGSVQSYPTLACALRLEARIEQFATCYCTVRQVM